MTVSKKSDRNEIQIYAKDINLIYTVNLELKSSEEPQEYSRQEIKIEDGTCTVPMNRKFIGILELLRIVCTGDAHHLKLVIRCVPDAKFTTRPGRYFYISNLTTLLP